MIETTEPAEASISSRIKDLEGQYQYFVRLRQEALQTAQAHAEMMLRTEGAIGELQRLKEEIWGTPEVQE